MGTRIKGNQIDYPIAAFDTPVIVGVDPTDGQAIYRVIFDATSDVIAKGVDDSDFYISNLSIDMNSKSRVIRADAEWEADFSPTSIIEGGINGICDLFVMSAGRGTGAAYVRSNLLAGLTWGMFTKFWLVFDYKD